MQVSVETTHGLERRMTVALPSEDIDSAINERLRSLSKTARLNGFRPGKVPFKVVKKRFEPQVREEVLGNLINRSYQQAIQQESLRPASQPHIEAEDTNQADAEAFSFVAVFEVFPDFDPMYDERIEIDRPAVEIGEEDIDRMLETMRRQRTDYETVERPADERDQVVIDFLGRIDGEPFEGGKAENAPLVLGSGAMIEGFETQLIGLSAGDQKTIDVTFPAEYQAEQLAGKTAEFDISVREVNEAKLPDVDEELVRSFGVEDGLVESLRADIRRNMQRELDQRVEQHIKTQILDRLVELNQIDVPDALLKEEIVRQKDQLLQQLPQDTDLAKLGDDLFIEQARKRVRLGLLMGEIVQKENIKADAAAIRQQVEKLSSSYQDPQQVIDYYYANAEMMRNVEGLVLEEAAISAVLEKVNVVDRTVPFQEFMNPSAKGEPAADAPAEEPDDNDSSAGNTSS